MSSWTANSIDSLEGKNFLITGGTSGIGLATARVLVEHGGNVVIAADDENKGEEAARVIREGSGRGRVTYWPLDLGSQRSIFGFSQRFLQEHSSLDVLINNGGLSSIPRRLESADGHELTLAVNYLGHFVLTSQLFPLLLRSRDPRVVSVSSLSHREGRLHFEDLELRRRYLAGEAYAQSKLAMLVFALELHRRCRKVGLRLKSIPVHPGLADTHIFDRGPAIAQRYFSPMPLFSRLMMKIFAQGAERGALPTLFAATSLEARGGVYYGPDGIMELRGNPTEARVSVHAENLLTGERLWEASERLTGVRFDVENSRSIGLH